MQERTVHDLVVALGGTSKVAELMKVGPTSVSNAKAANQIPERWKFRLFKILQRRGVTGFNKLFDAEPVSRRKTKSQNDNSGERSNSAA